jgi:hypothetical protein
MQATIHIRVPHVRDGLIVANVGGVTKVGWCSYQNGVVILSGARSAESKDLRLSSSHRRTC